MSIDRRSFLQAGAGLMIGIALPLPPQDPNAPQGPPPLNPYAAYLDPPPIEVIGSRLPNRIPNALIHIAPDETVTLQITRAEMGQGPLTACAQLLAEELDCDWSRVRVEFAPVNPAVYGHQTTVGSQSMRTTWEPLRNGGACAREMLISAAAQEWSVDRSQCRAENGFVINTATQAKLSYGTLADAASKLPVPEQVKYKDPSQYRIIGKPMKRLDTHDKVTGRAPFGIDTRLPGMVYAIVERCPVFGGKVASFDATQAKAVPGVKDVIQIASGIAVVADSTWSAMQGRRALKVNWDEGAGASLNSDGISALLAQRAREDGTVARKDGDAEAGLAKAAKKIQASYEVPYLSHAAMEPISCTAHVRPDGADIWGASQSATSSRDIAAKVTGLPPEKVTFHAKYLGGGFGRRGEGQLDFIAEAADLGKRLGVPVKITWSREDDMQHDFYRPASYVEFVGGLDADGWASVLSARVACPPFPGIFKGGVSGTGVSGLRDLLYVFPHYHLDYRAAMTTVPVSFWRAPGANQNVFFIESFVDEMAAAGGKDPIEFRRRLLAGTPRLLNVLNLAAEKSGWGKPLPSGRFQGVALASNVGSFNAQVAEISIVKGKVRVHRVICAMDVGQVVNPTILTQQIEGGIAFGLAAALKGAITVDRGRVQQTNFNTYDVLRMDEMPKVEVYLVPSTENPSGAGEASVPPIAPAATNAIFAATGKRIRKLPIRLVSFA
jgi:isoquinoline 1-oxidoreductase beta subunit